MSAGSAYQTRSVLVIGAQGVLGGLIARAFEAAGWDVLRGGRRPDGEPGLRLVDLDRPDTVTAALEGVDVAVNTVPDTSMTAERAVLERGGALVNVSALPVAAVGALRDSGRDRRGTVVVNAGLAPGITNLVAAELLAAHPEADAVELALTFSAAGVNGRAGREFSHRNLTAVRRHRTAAIPLPEPFGERRCLEFAETERGWLGAVADGMTVRSYACFAERGLHRTLLALNRVGAIAPLTRVAVAAGRGGAPREPSREPVAEWIAVLRGGERVAARTVEAAGDYGSTAAVTAILAGSLLDRGHAAPSGCFHPEELFELGELEPRLRGVGIEIVPQQVGA
jgi:hypothetical protein